MVCMAGRYRMISKKDVTVKELPTFFINDVMFVGKPTFANLSAAIESALKKGKSKAPVKKAAVKQKQRA